MVINGEIRDAGVFAPEGIVDSEIFFKKFCQETKIYRKETNEESSVL
jgi:hypothetical protein